MTWKGVRNYIAYNMPDLNLSLNPAANLIPG